MGVWNGQLGGALVTYKRVYVGEAALAADVITALKKPSGKAVLAADLTTALRKVGRSEILLIFLAASADRDFETMT